MGKCQICNCPNNDSETGQITFPLIKNLSLFSEEYASNNNNNHNKNLSLFTNPQCTIERNTIDQIKLTNTEKKNALKT